MPARSFSRRQFLQTSAAALATTSVIEAAPQVHTTNKAGSEFIVGEGDYQYRLEHDRFQLPGEYSWQTTHNVAVDKAGHVYVIHQGLPAQKDHPSIFVFDADGTFVKAFGQRFQGGGHGLEVREENGEEFLYVTTYLHLKFISKITLDGEEVWTKHAPMSTGLYKEGEDTQPDGTWGRDRFMPTNYAFLDDGGFFLADGYGAHVIHHYNADGEVIGTIGKPGKGDGEFNLPHGLWIDDRGEEKLLAVADRGNWRLQWFTLDGEHRRTQAGFQLPANIDVYEDLMLVPELKARITLLDKDNNVAVRLGGDPEWQEKVTAGNFALRRDPAQWEGGRFLHPHDACFDHDGNILVAEWVQTGRVSKLTRV